MVERENSENGQENDKIIRDYHNFCKSTNENSMIRHGTEQNFM